jgi:murein DD-endopeptidase MepM/ murein hydrolase activator NlpD
LPETVPCRRTGLLVPLAAALLLLCGGPAAAKAVSSRLPAIAPPPPTTTLLPPVSDACISSPFGPRVLPNRPLAGTFHNGIDLPAAAGTPVRAIASGELIRVQRRGPGGLEILVQHPGFIGIYSHLGMVAPAIAEGGRHISPGEQLGVVGHTGVTYGMHLFFGMIVQGRSVDPATFLQLPLCVAAHRTPADSLASDGRVPPTRRYGVLPIRRYGMLQKYNTQR